jgi:hypothetical protein
MIDLKKDLWLFMREWERFWLAPIIIVLVLLGGLIVFDQCSAVAPFIYTLFLLDSILILKHEFVNRSFQKRLFINKC